MMITDKWAATWTLKFALHVVVEALSSTTPPHRMTPKNRLAVMKIDVVRRMVASRITILSVSTMACLIRWENRQYLLSQ